MKSTLFFFFGLLFSSILFSQEICDNAIDDDGDGLIDLNDDDCECSEIFGLDLETNVIPNYSFEENTCCPDGISDTDCVNDWDNIVGGTSDYLNV